MDKVKLFTSYAHADKESLNEFFTYVNDTTCPLIDIWHDERIALGEEWNAEIKDSLDKADIVLLFVSQPFLMSPYIKDNELATALRRHDEKEATVIPIFLRACTLNNYPQITRLQGYPGRETPLFEAGVKKDRYYVEIQGKINDIAEKIIEKKKIASISGNKNDALSDQALKIEALMNTKKIFLSIPSSVEGQELRKYFIITVEGKIKYDTPKWPYEIIPGILEAAPISTLHEEDQEKELAALINQTIYDIHIIGTAADLKSSLFNLQYRLAKTSKSQPPQTHTILWFQDAAIKEELEILDDAFKLELKMLPTVMGKDSSTIFTMIENFDIEKQKMINTLSSAFSASRKIFMFYDFEKDNDNDLRIKLRKMIQENKDYSIRDPADENFENQVKEINECSGAVIFYGSESSSMWYRTRQKIILKAHNIKAGAVCVDGKEKPEIEKKIDRDVYINEILPIKGNEELETGVTKFKTKLQEQQ